MYLKIEIFGPNASEITQIFASNTINNIITKIHDKYGHYPQIELGVNSCHHKIIEKFIELYPMCTKFKTTNIYKNPTFMDNKTFQQHIVDFEFPLDKYCFYEFEQLLEATKILRTVTFTAMKHSYFRSNSLKAAIINNYTVTNYTINVKNITTYDFLKTIAERNHYIREIIRSSALTLLLIRKFRRSMLDPIDKNVILIISKLIYEQIYSAEDCKQFIPHLPQKFLNFYYNSIK